MFFQILKREIRSSHAKILLISLTKIPNIPKICNYTIKIHIFCANSDSLKFQFSEKSISDWDWKGQQPIIRPNKVTVGIIGLGRIGTAVALRLKGFNYQIQFYHQLDFQDWRFLFGHPP